jgi:acetolactate synthase-1/2/3 large subunit
MDFETAVRERIPILSILLNNFSMAIEIPIMPISQKKYKSTDISGDYSAMAKAFGGYGERITQPKDIIPAIKRGIAATKKGQAALLEFITCKETVISRYLPEN